MAVIATFVEAVTRDDRGRFSSGGGAAKKGGDARAETPAKRAPVGTKSQPSNGKPPGKYGGFRYILPEHGRAIFRKAGQRAGRQSEQGMVDVGRGRPAGMTRAMLDEREAVGASSQTQLLRAADAEHRVTLLRPVRAKLVTDDHTPKVPVKSFQDDLDRKLKLRRVMGGEQEQSTPVELPPEGMKFIKEDVNYRYAGDKTRACGDCRFFREPGACEIVAGLIRRVDTCDKFTPESKEIIRASLVPAAESEVTPAGYEPVVRALKKQPDVKSPWAVAWWMKGQGIRPKKSSSEVEVTPPGYEPVVKALKRAGRVTNPWAVAWWMKGQGIRPKKKATERLVLAMLGEGGPGSGPHPTGRSLTISRLQKLSPAQRAQAIRTIRRQTQVEGGPGSGRRPGASKFAPERQPDEEERMTGKFTRRETPEQRAQRIRRMKVDPAVARVVRRAFTRAVLVERSA